MKGCQMRSPLECMPAVNRDRCHYYYRGNCESDGRKQTVVGRVRRRACSTVRDPQL